MSVRKSELVGKSVYDQEAKHVGRVIDIAIRLGEKEVFLLVGTPSGATIEVPWDKVAAAKDIVLLKEKVELPAEVILPAATVAAQPPAPRLSLPFLRRKEERICPHCGKPATWITQYQRWYCYNCQKYLD